MRGLEQLRFVSNFSDIEGLERSLEAALIVADGEMSQEEIFLGLVTLVKNCSTETEVWVLANRILGAASPYEEAERAYLDICDHECPFHGFEFPLVALSPHWQVVARGSSWPLGSSCGWRIVPDEVALALGRVGERETIEVAKDVVRLVEGRRTPVTMWPPLASSLVAFVKEVDGCPRGAIS